METIKITLPEKMFEAEADLILAYAEVRGFKITKTIKVEEQVGETDLEPEIQEVEKEVPREDIIKDVQDFFVEYNNKIRNKDIQEAFSYINKVVVNKQRKLEDEGIENAIVQNVENSIIK